MGMPRIRAIVFAAVIAALATLVSAAERKLVVGIPPLDIAAEGVDQSAGQVLAKLIRIEMIKNARLQPVLLTEVPPKPD